MITKTEALKRAGRGLQMVVADLREALKASNNVEGLALRHYIGEAAELHASVDALRAAVEADQKGGAE